MKASFREYDVVRVVRLDSSVKTIAATDRVARSPRIGDVGTIVSNYGERHVCVESIDQEGLTVWLADFDTSALELVTRSSDEKKA
jgi:hypothetical protein